MNKKTSKAINAFDIETILVNGSYIPFCLVYSYKSKYYYFYGSDVIEKCLDSMKQNLIKNYTHIFYIHNINFDGILLIEYLSNFNYPLDIMGFNGNIYYLRVYMDEICIEWRCSYKLVPLSLKVIGEKWINIKKLPFPYKILSKKFNDETIPQKEDFNDDESYKEWVEKYSFYNFKEYTIKYCERDVIITKKFVEKFWDVMKSFRISRNNQIYSIPSFSVKIFFKYFNCYKISENLDGSIDRYVRQAYCGGRCEVFGNPLPNDYIFHFDFKGMYAQCMKEKFPTGESKYVFGVKEVKKPGFYYIDWEYKGNIPILPIKDESTSKLMFYEGKGSGLYWYEEILLFLDYGGVINKVYSALIYEKMQFVFSDYVDEMNKIREKGGVYKDIGKLLVNSIYGRLGMGRENTRTIVTYDDKLVPNMIKFNKINKLIIGEVVDYSEFEGISNVALAAIITSKARIKLYKGFMDVQKEGGRILYSDTDSIIASFKRDVSNEKHGEIYWDISKADTKIKKACFALPKTYSILFEKGWTTKIKGIKRNYIHFNEFYKLFKNNETVVDSDFFNIKKKNYSLKYNYSSKKVDLSSYSKRVWCKDKIYTKPFILR
jgi:hypothetical protein